MTLMNSEMSKKQRLPRNRKEVFKRVIKENWKTLLLCSAILALAGLPFVVTGIIKYNYEININSAVINLQMTKAQALKTLRLTYNIINVVEVLLYIIFGLTLSSVIQIIKELAFYQEFDIKDTLKRGFVQNAKQYFTLFLIIGLLMFECRYIIMLDYGVYGLIPSIIGLIILGPIALYMLVTISIYDIKFTKQVRYCFITINEKIVTSFLVYLICLVPFAIMVVSDIYLDIYFSVIIKIVMFFSLSIFLLGWYLFCLEGLDSFINEKHYPNLVRKGLYTPE